MSNASRRVMAANPRLDSLRKILAQERASGYQDSTVIGGLDRFLQHWAEELEPVLGGAGSYSILTPLQREEWAGTVGPRLRADDAADGTPSKRARPRAPRRVPPVPLDTAVSDLKGVAKQTLPKLKRLGLQKVEDLVYHFPLRHNDFAKMSKVSELKPGEEQTVIVSVWEASETRQGQKRRSTQAVLGDETGNVRATWFNQPYLATTFKPGTSLVISGKVNVFRGSLVFQSPEYEILRGQEELVHTGRLVPVYPSVDGLPQRTLRRFVKRALDTSLSQVVDFLPEDTRHRAGLMSLPNAIAQAHYPDGEADWASARRRLAFDELFLLQLAVVRRKKEWQQEDQGIPLHAGASAVDGFLEALPFNLTGAQSRVLDEIMADLSQSRPMSRLLQGDVGSGKTVVAAAALLLAVVNGRQGALVAPTEILAEQHFLTMVDLLSRGNGGDEHATSASFEVHGMGRPVTVGLLVGSLSRKAKNEMHARIRDGDVDIAVGTHALLQEAVDIPRLAVAVVDEQHRFGVMQRASVREKGGRPHLLAMSATPIPRSLALTLYGELDISTIDEMPAGRRRIRTRWLEPDSRSTAYAFIDKQVEQGRQTFVVCPLIEDSEVVQARAATEEYERLSRDVFPGLRLGLLHGRMALREKEEVMARFKAGEVQVLVATPVIEVGIDIPNASVMLIDGADRFGLAQLHQLRGRVGRGMHESYCILLADSPGPDARERLKLVERSGDGFELAEEDLRLRGPGDYLGTRQSGLPSLKVARITDQDILAVARAEAVRILDADPELEAEGNAPLAERLAKETADLPGEIS